MSRIRSASGAIAAMLTTAVALADADARALHGAPVLIPAPASIALREGSFTLRDGTLVSVEGGDQALLVAQQFAARVQDIGGPRLRVVGAGEVITFGAHHVHALHNDADAEAMSVHVYSPPLGPMTFFDE